MIRSNAEILEGSDYFLFFISLTGVDSFSVLLSYGAEIDTQDLTGMSPLMDAVFWENVQITRIFLPYNPRLDFKGRAFILLGQIVALYFSYFCPPWVLEKQREFFVVAHERLTSHVLPQSDS